MLCGLQNGRIRGEDIFFTNCFVNTGTPEDPFYFTGDAGNEQELAAFFHVFYKLYQSHNGGGIQKILCQLSLRPLLTYNSLTII